MKMALPMYLVVESMGMVEGEAAFCMVICLCQRDLRF
jgi:hypothetical protein